MESTIYKNIIDSEKITVMSLIANSKPASEAILTGISEAQLKDVGVLDMFWDWVKTDITKQIWTIIRDKRGYSSHDASNIFNIFWPRVCSNLTILLTIRK